MQLNNTKPVIILGNRVYSALSWKRKDTIFYDGIKIGYILLSQTDRVGITISTINHEQVVGRKIDWCMEQAKTNPGKIKAKIDGQQKQQRGLYCHARQSK